MSIVTTTSELEKLCREWSRQPFLTIDTEFLREKTYYSKLCLMQVGTPGGSAWAIDPIEGNLDLSPLFELLFDEKILKVIHSGRQDLEIFYNLTGKIVQPLFDTQIAAMVCGYGDSIGYENLVRGITGKSLDKSVQFTDWSKRPLSQRQIDYALGDVTHLVEIYNKLDAELEKKGRTEWVFEEEETLTSPDTYNNDPAEAWKRIKLRSPKPRMLVVLQPLAAWREKKAQDRDIPRSWVLRDETLADLAAQTPETIDQLKKIRGISAEMAAGNTGKAILEIIQKALATDKKDWPRAEERKILPPQAGATVDILKMLLKIQCAEHNVATKLVASQEDLEIIATQKSPDTPVMKGWRYDVFGRDAMELKAGKLAVGLRGNVITKYRINETSESY